MLTKKEQPKWAVLSLGEHDEEEAFDVAENRSL